MKKKHSEMEMKIKAFASTMWGKMRKLPNKHTAQAKIKQVKHDAAKQNRTS